MIEKKIVFEKEFSGVETIISTLEASITDVIFYTSKDNRILEDIFVEFGEKSLELIEKEVKI